jgi:hypothetical protein
MFYDDNTDYKEFPVIIEARNYPIHAWLTHSESYLNNYFHDATDDDSLAIILHEKPYVLTPPITALFRDKRKEFCSSLSDSFTSICREYAEKKPPQKLNRDLHLVLKESDRFMRKFTCFGAEPCYMIAWGVSSLHDLQKV